MNKNISIEEALQNADNVAEIMDEEDLDHLASDIIDWYDTDLDSRSKWEKMQQGYLELSTQVVKNKTFPWPNSANVKYPLLTVACIQFNARAYKSIMPNAKVAKARVIGHDPDGSKQEIADRISMHMSYQLVEQMETWEEELDKLTLVLPICGNAFRKTYRGNGSNVSELVLPQDLVVNYYAKSIEQAQVKTHKQLMPRNTVIENQRLGTFLDIDLDLSTDVPDPQKGPNTDDAHGMTAPSTLEGAEEDLLLECHCFLDLDDDGYKEPYFVTVHRESEKVLRVVPRFDSGDIVRNNEGLVAKITPYEYFTNYVFVPDPVSGVYGLGFGSLIGPLNETSDTLINQLLDSGTLYNLPSGFLARGIRIKDGNKALRPGEWRHVNSTGDDLRKSIVPLPVRQPSDVLFQLLSLMLSAGKELSSITDLMKGESPGQNQPYSTTSAMLEQGLMVYSSIYKRMYRALKKELKKLYNLNKKYVTGQEYFSVIDSDKNEVKGQVSNTDYNTPYTDVIPAADPNIVADAQNLAKSEALIPFIQMGTVNKQVATKRALQAQGQEGIDELMQMPPPQPDFDQQIEMQKLEIQKAQLMGEQQLEEMKTQYRAARDAASATKTKVDTMVSQQRMELDKVKEAFHQEMEEAKLALEEAKLHLNEKEVQVNALLEDKKIREQNTVKYNPETKKLEK